MDAKICFEINQCLNIFQINWDNEDWFKMLPTIEFNQALNMLSTVQEKSREIKIHAIWNRFIDLGRRTKSVEL